MPNIKVELGAPSAGITKDSAKYEYQPLLNDSEIRLVKLYPLLPQDGPREQRAEPLSPLRINLVHTALADAPHFGAISYTWGTVLQQDMVLVDGDRYIDVSENVKGILQRLRPEATEKEIYLWNDQLCINQSDDYERWRQIQKMRQIYNCAKVTIVVLAGSGKVFDPVLLQLNLLGLHPLRTSPGPIFRIPGEGPIGIAHHWSGEQIPNIIHGLFQSEPFRKDFIAIVENAVFRRGWIYQEIVSSKRVVLLGQTYELDWDLFARAFELFLRLEAEKLDHPLQISSSVAALDLIIGNRIIHQNGRYNDWMLLHTQAQGLLCCTDLRDNTIALTTFENFYPEIPSYRNLSVASLYTEATIAMIAVSKTLDVFGAISGHWHDPQREREEMPSWVPDWSRERDSIPLYWPRSETAFDAASGYPCTIIREIPRTSRGRLILLAKGKKIDTVTSRVERPFEDFGSEMSIKNVLLLQEHCFDWVRHAEQRGCPLIQERTFEKCKPLTRAMMAAMTASFSSYSSFISDNFLGPIPDVVYDELVFMIAWHDEIMAGEKLFHNGLPHCFSFMTRTFGSWKAGMAKLRQWTSICSGRRIVFGEAQGFGLAPKTTRGRDIICILHGSKVPVVLRRLGRCYRVIGQCYWHGWMYGDKVDWSEDEGECFQLI